MYIIVTDNEKITELALKSGAQIIKVDQNDVKQILVNPEDKVNNVMNMFSFKPNLNGYHYLKFIFETCVKDKKYHQCGITTVIYPEVAKKFNSTSTKVARSVRHCILRSFEQVPERYTQLFNRSLNGPPSFSQFISIVSEKLL